jgi:hypothetical protein
MPRVLLTRPQIILKVYYVTADLTLVWQYVRYTHRRQCRKESQQAYEVISGDDNCSADDPAGQRFQDTSLIENDYEDSQGVKKRSVGEPEAADSGSCLKIDSATDPKVALTAVVIW